VCVGVGVGVCVCACRCVSPMRMFVHDLVETKHLECRFWVRVCVGVGCLITIAYLTNHSFTLPPIIHHTHIHNTHYTLSITHCALPTHTHTTHHPLYTTGIIFLNTLLISFQTDQTWQVDWGWHFGVVDCIFLAIYIMGMCECVCVV
jgi:hypothetical protein